MSGYKTYLAGTAAYFSPEIIAAIQNNIWEKGYVSIWRVLHIDGFEPSFVRAVLPISTGRQLYFFRTTVVEPKWLDKYREQTKDESCIWTNGGKYGAVLKDEVSWLHEGEQPYPCGSCGQLWKPGHVCWFNGGPLPKLVR